MNSLLGECRLFGMVDCVERRALLIDAVRIFHRTDLVKLERR